MTTDQPNTAPAPAPVDPAPATGPTWAALAEIINTLPPANPAPYPDHDLRQRVAAALLARIKQAVVPAPDRLWPGRIGSLFAATEYDLADVALAALAPELGRAQLGDRTRQELADLAVNAANALRDEKRHYRIACQEIARLHELVDRLGETERQQRARLDRIRQMVDAWEQQLPDTIRTATAVDAIRTALGAPTPAEEA